MKILKFLLSILTSLLCGGIVLLIFYALCQFMLERLKETGGVITANTILEYQVMPYFVAFIAACAWFYIIEKDSQNN